MSAIREGIRTLNGFLSASTHGKDTRARPAEDEGLVRWNENLFTTQEVVETGAAVQWDETLSGELMTRLTRSFFRSVCSDRHPNYLTNHHRCGGKRTEDCEASR